MNSIYASSVRTQDTFSSFMVGNNFLVQTALNAQKLIISEVKNKITALTELYSITGSDIRPIKLDVLIERELAQEDVYAYQDGIFLRLIGVLDKDHEYVDIPDSVDSADDFYTWIQSL